MRELIRDTQIRWHKFRARYAQERGDVKSAVNHLVAAYRLADDRPQRRRLQLDARRLERARQQ